MLEKSQIFSHQKSPEIKAFANVDILIAISDFIDDKDLFNFILINKTTYKTLSRSRLIEVRLLKYQLKNAKSVLKEFEPQLRENAKLLKKKEQKAKLQEPISLFPYSSFQSYSHYYNTQFLNHTITKYITAYGNNTYDDETEARQLAEKRKMEILSEIDNKLNSPPKQKGLFLSNSQVRSNSYYKSLSQISSKSEIKKKKMMHALQKQQNKQQNQQASNSEGFGTMLYNRYQDFVDMYFGPKYITKHM